MVFGAVGIVVSAPADHSSNGVCYVQVPKVASHSLVTLLGVPMSHHTARDHNLSACWSFAIARNPWDRMSSWYLYCRKGYGMYGDLPKPYRACALARRLDFSAWLEKVLTKSDLNHLDSVARWVLDENGRQLVDYVGQYENLQEVVDTVAARFSGLRPLPRLQHLNRGGKSVLCLSAAADSLIRQRFAWEIERFSYKPVSSVIVEVGSPTTRTAIEHRVDLSCSAAAGLRQVAADAWADLQHWLSSSMSAARELPRSLLITVFVHSRFGRWWLSSRNVALWPKPARGQEGAAFLSVLRRSFEEPLPADQECLLGRWAAWLLVHELSVEAGVNLIGKHGPLFLGRTQLLSSPLASLLWPPSTSASGSRSPSAALAADAVDELDSSSARSASTPSCTPQKAHAPSWETVGTSSWRIFALLARLSHTVGRAWPSNISLATIFTAKFKMKRAGWGILADARARADVLSVQSQPWWPSFALSRNVTVRAQRLRAVRQLFGAEIEFRKFAETFPSPAKGIAAVLAFDAYYGLFKSLDGFLLQTSGQGR
eukprot:TRINITY_DN7727_c0_g1_i8.p1 TRINITY_DN7727_c0_g1~~TRINITY_DN7727_c0_g1_i8.p1  ORF type:complete len:583 (-),score=45.90 TRINITY_DN7727_c0_g1_i8:81-1706(-)